MATGVANNHNNKGLWILQYTIVIKIIQPPLQTALLDKCTDFQLFAMNKSINSNWNSSTQQKFQVVSSNSTENATFNECSLLKEFYRTQDKQGARQTRLEN